MSLTDDWKSEKLEAGWYWVKTECGFIQPVYYLIMRVKGELIKGFAEEPEDRVTEVFAPCDYNHFVDLTEKVKYLESMATKATEIAQAASDNNEQLRELLEESKEYLSDVDTYFTKNADENNFAGDNLLDYVCEKNPESDLYEDFRDVGWYAKETLKALNGESSKI